MSEDIKLVAVPVTDRPVATPVTEGGSGSQQDTTGDIIRAAALIFGVAVGGVGFVAVIMCGFSALSSLEVDLTNQDLITVLEVGAGLFIASLIGGLIGRLKDRTAEGAVLGFLLGPLGWLIAALLKSAKPTCPECGGVVVAGVRRCKNCGAELVK